MPKRIAILAATTALLLLLAACSSTPDGTAGDTTPGGTAGDTGGDTGGGAAAGDLPDLSGESMEVAAVWTGDEQAAFEAVLDEFAARTGADVAFTSTGDNISSVLGTRIQGGSPPAVAVLPQPGLLVDFADQGALTPVSQAVADTIDANYAEVWRELGSVDGELYGVWFKAANKSTVWYNVGLFEDASVTPPEDWEGLQDAAQTLSAFGVPAYSIGGADGWTLTDWFENVYLRTAGPESYDELARHEIPWTDETVVEALNTLAEVWGERDLIAGNPLQVSFPDSVAQVFSDPPDAAIVYEGDFVAGVISGETDAVVGEDADFFGFPAIGEGTGGVVGGGDVAVLLDGSDAGQALLQFLAMPDAAEIWAERGGFISPNQNVDTSVYPDDITQRIAMELAEADTFRFDLSDLQPSAFGGTPGQGLFKLLQDFLQNPDDAESIAQQLEDAAADAFESTLEQPTSPVGGSGDAGTATPTEGATGAATPTGGATPTPTGT